MPTSRAIHIPTRSRLWIARPATPIRRPARRQRSRRRQGTSLHKLPRQRARDLSQDRPALGRLSAQRSQDLRHTATATMAWRSKHGLANVYPNYMDSIHGFALSKEGLLVAANCQSCHGSHSILSHTNPAEPDLQDQHSQDLRQLPRQNRRRLRAGRTRQGHRQRRSEGAGLHATATRRTPSCSPRNRRSACSPRPSAATATRTSSPPTATPSTRSWVRWAATWRRRAAGIATGRTTCGRASDPELAHQPGQPGHHLRPVPRRR